MPQQDTLALFMIAALALNVTPGPGMVYVIARNALVRAQQATAVRLERATGLVFIGLGVRLAVSHR